MHGATVILSLADGSLFGTASSLDEIAEKFPRLIPTNGHRIGRVLIAPAQVIRVTPYSEKDYGNLAAKGGRTMLRFANAQERVLLDEPADVAQRITAAIIATS